MQGKKSTCIFLWFNTWKVDIFYASVILVSSRLWNHEGSFICSYGLDSKVRLSVSELSSISSSSTRWGLMGHLRSTSASDLMNSFSETSQQLDGEHQFNPLHGFSFSGKGWERSGCYLRLRGDFSPASCQYLSAACCRTSTLEMIHWW